MRLYILLISLILMSSCHPGRGKPTVAKKPGRTEMADLNRYLVQKDREIIQNYIERKGLKLAESPTGLWYMVRNPGKGRLFKNNDRIIINYSCSLLDGTVCYSSETLGPREIILGKTGIEAGLDEGLRLLRPEAEAVFILPPFLAFGLVGDGKKIPPRTTIVYTIEVMASGR